MLLREEHYQSLSDRMRGLIVCGGTAHDKENKALPSFKHCGR